MVKVWDGNHREMALKAKAVGTTKARCPNPELCGGSSVRAVPDYCLVVSGVRVKGVEKGGHGASTRGKTKK